MSQKTQMWNPNRDAPKNTSENLKAEFQMLSAVLSYKGIWERVKNPHTLSPGQQKTLRNLLLKNNFDN